MEYKYTHIDLFSGIGGFSLAFDNIFNEQENNHIFVEIDPFCQAVLRKHWPEAEIHGDIRAFDGGESEPFLLTGGFPCQPFSQAGKRKGTEDNRHLWPDMLRVIQVTKPEWVIAENVRGLLSIEGGVVFEQVCLDLEANGYEVQPIVIPAVAVNAPHRRDRVWFIAHAIGSEHRGRGRQESEEESLQRVSGETRHVRRSSGTDKVYDSTNSRQQHGESRGNEEMGFCKAKRSSCKSDIERCSENVTDTSDEGLQGRKPNKWKGHSGQRDRNGSKERRSWEQDWTEVATRLCRIHDGIPRRLDRNPRLKALGNAIVPAVAEEIIKAIKWTIQSQNQ